MKKFLMLAIILLNLLPVISDSDYYRASAQTWSTEYDVCYMASTNTYYFWDKGDCADDERCCQCDLCGDWISESFFHEHVKVLHQVLYDEENNKNKSGNEASKDENSNNENTEHNNSDDDTSIGYAFTYDSRHGYVKDVVRYQNNYYIPPLGVTMCKQVPLKYPYIQTIEYECVACAAATMVDIMESENPTLGSKLYQDVYRDISNYARSKNVDFFEKPFDGDCNYYYHILHDVAGLNVDNCGDVESYIDKGCAVLGCGLFGTPSPSAVEHMVTIVGYDYSNYYCIDPGYSKVQVYPKNNFNADYFYGYSK